MAKQRGEGQMNFVAVVEQEIYDGYIRKGIRKSKYDLRVNLTKGEVVIIAVPAEGVPGIFKVPGGLDALDYHPGNLLVPARFIVPVEGEILHVNSCFKIYTTEQYMSEALAYAAMRKGGDLTAHIPLMERIIIKRAYAGKFTDADDIAWDKYQKLKARFTHPTTPTPEKVVSAKMAAKMLVKIVAPQLALNGNKNN